VTTRAPSQPDLARLLSGTEAHLWYVRPEQVSAEQLAAYRGLLCADELEREGRFLVEHARREHRIARALVRTTLSAYWPDVDPRAWTFTAGPYGRPEIAAPQRSPRLRFSLTHTPGLIACLVAAEREIGVDVEPSARHVDLESIAEHFFSPSEARALMALPPEARPERFFQYWTLKEAYLKARGFGLHLPLASFSFHLAPGQPIRIAFAPDLDDDPARWQLRLLRPIPSHCLAIAIRRADDAADLPLRVWPSLPRWPA
jgi:4'-phosphopantetheinyl transferase